MTLKLIIGAVAGTILGLGWYKLVGCPTGGCPLTRSPWSSALYGALLGVLVAISSR